jgi:hypothetical protein
VVRMPLHPTMTEINEFLRERGGFSRFLAIPAVVSSRMVSGSAVDQVDDAARVVPLVKQTGGQLVDAPGQQFHR